MRRLDNDADGRAGVMGRGHIGPGEDSMADLPRGVTVVDHPLVQHKLGLMRRKETSTAEFRQLLRETALLIGYEVTHDLPLTELEIETPLAKMRARKIDGKKLVVVSILRAGNGLLEGLLDLIPSARVGHIGLYRDPDTLRPVQYYLKVPQDLAERQVILVDPMLATGHSAAAAVARLKENGARNIKFACLLAAPEGIDNLLRQHPGLLIYTGAVDKHLNEHGYIVPGLGDAGDRLYGTK